MNKETPAQNNSKREKILAALKECAVKLGHPPSTTELNRFTNMKMYPIIKIFGSYTNALRAAGLEPARGGIRATMEELFTDWAEIVRRGKRIPTAPEYGFQSKHSTRPLLRRFGAWRNVPQGLLHYADEAGLEAEWHDVLEIARRYCRIKSRESTTNSTTTLTSSDITSATTTPRAMSGRRIYGAALVASAMVNAPTNEAAVLFMFGMLAQKLGFAITWVGTEFPDIEALREVAPGRFQRVAIELEFQSRNFLKHMHEISECDLIVCWENNWPDCPIEVIELRKAVSTQQSAFSQT